MECSVCTIKFEGGFEILDKTSGEVKAACSPSCLLVLAQRIKGDSVDCEILSETARVFVVSNPPV